MSRRPSKPDSAVRLLLIPFLLAGCKPAPESAACFQTLDRPAPGVLHLAGPIACGDAMERFQALGPPSRPEAVVFLDRDGLSPLRYNLHYNPDGKVALEERVFSERPQKVRLFQRGDRIEFPVTERDVVVERLRTSLDPAGRPVRVEKFRGPDLVYRVEREYQGGELLAERTFDGRGALKQALEVHGQGRERVEVMTDGQGRELLRRPVPPR